MKKLVLLVFLFPFLSNAQKEISLYGLKHVPQIVYFNPALAPNGRINVGFPGISSLNLSAGRSDFLVSGLFNTNSDGQEQFDVKKFVDGLEDENSLFGQIAVDVMHVGVASGRNYFHFNITDRVDISNSFPKQAAAFINEVYEENYLDQDVSINNIQFELQHYREFGFGMSRNVNEKLRVGGTFKILSGIGNVRTSDLDIRFDSDLATDSIVGGSVNFDLKSSGVDDYSGDDVTGHLIGFNNIGYAFDIGANYKLNERFEFSFAMLDIMSKINWTNNVRNYKGDNVGVEFSLLNAEDLFGNGRDEGALETITDSLQQAFEESENSDHYNSPVPTKLNFVASYNLTPKTQLSLISHNILYENDPQSYLKLAFNGRLNKVFNGVLSYALIDEYETPMNLGVGFALNLGFFQIHALTENVLVAFVSPDESKNPTLRFGVNMTFARDNQ